MCESIYHYASNCPENERRSKDVHLAETKEDASSDKESLITIALATGTNLLYECLNHAILDTACSGTVCGQAWLEHFLDCLSPSQRKNVKFDESSTQIVFGDMKKVPAPLKVTLPVEICKTKCTVTADVVPNELPLLLSKSSMKKAGISLDMKSDSAKIFGQMTKLKTTKSGHYIVSVLPVTSNQPETVFIASLKESKLSSEQIRKLHIQFGHCSEVALTRLLKGAKISFDMKSLRSVCSDCEICHRRSYPARKPVVSVPLASESNDLVALDLHYISENSWYLHMICLFSKFSVATVITSKKPESIIGALMTRWISIFGRPKTGFLTDNGGEFANNLLLELTEQMNIKLISTAAYSPQSNGVCERHNRTLTEVFERVRLEFPKLDQETCLAFSCAAKNDVFNNSGFTPSQIMFGRNPNINSVLTDKLPALQNSPSMSDYVSNLLAMLKLTRTRYIEAEYSQKVARALRHNIRHVEVCDIGDSVYYRRYPAKNWRGPGKIIGKESKVFLSVMLGRLLRYTRRMFSMSGMKRKKKKSPSPMFTRTNQTMFKLVQLCQMTKKCIPNQRMSKLLKNLKIIVLIRTVWKK